MNLIALVCMSLRPKYFVALHKKWSFLLTISSVNMTKPAGGFGHIYWKSPQWKTPFFVQCCLVQRRVDPLIPGGNKRPYVFKKKPHVKAADLF